MVAGNWLGGLLAWYAGDSGLVQEDVVHCAERGRRSWGCFGGGVSGMPGMRAGARRA